MSSWFEEEKDVESYIDVHEDLVFCMLIPGSL
jgi:hypothetical protein